MMPTTTSVGSYSVGSLSALNAFAGSASEDLPVVILAGGPGTSAKAEFDCCITRSRPSTTT
jgi:TPP-dependent 2-oxoacid decarboxylase